MRADLAWVCLRAILVRALLGLAATARVHARVRIQALVAATGGRAHALRADAATTAAADAAASCTAGIVLLVLVLASSTTLVGQEDERCERRAIDDHELTRARRLSERTTHGMRHSRAHWKRSGVA